MEMWSWTCPAVQVTAEITLGIAAPAAEGSTPEGETFPEDNDVTGDETADNADVPAETDGEPTDEADEPKTADEELTEGTETQSHRQMIRQQPVMSRRAQNRSVLLRKTLQL